MPANEETIRGSLLGLAVADALGLPCEGLSRRRQARLFPDLRGHRLFFRHGFCSDDTEHACMTARALLDGRGDADRFARGLAWRLRFWLLGLPAGVGLATGRAIIRLWLGFPARHSGVFSAGNGPAMRAPIIGVVHGDDPGRLRDFIRASTRLTHTDPKAEFGALAVAVATHLNATHPGPVTPAAFAESLRTHLPEAGATEFHAVMARSLESAVAGESAERFAQRLGLEKGVSGYIYHTVPVVIQVWLRHQRDYAGGVLEIIRLGGDTDTTAAILGGIIGAGTGETAIPRPWLAHLWEWPRSVPWMRRLAAALATNGAPVKPSLPPGVFPLAIWVRNLFFLTVVLFHGFRRLLPPY